MKAIDIRSESAVKLLAEFLDMDTPYAEGERFPNAEHFAHGKSCDLQFSVVRYDPLSKQTGSNLREPITELYCYLRSPYKSLSTYDANAQVVPFCRV